MIKNPMIEEGTIEEGTYEQIQKKQRYDYLNSIFETLSDSKKSLFITIYIKYLDAEKKMQNKEMQNKLYDEMLAFDDFHKKK